MDEKRKILGSYLKAGYPLMYLSTVDYEHVVPKVIEEVAESPGTEKDAKVLVWKPASMAEAPISSWVYDEDFEPGFIFRDLMEVLDQFIGDDNVILALLVNVREFMSNPMVYQKILDAAYTAKARGSHIIMVGVRPEIPPELKSVTTMIDVPLPDKEQLVEIFGSIASSYKDVITQGSKTWADTMEKTGGRFSKKQKAILNDAARASLGLDQFAAENAFCLAVAKTKTIDISVLQAQKEDEVRKSDVLEFVPTAEGMSAVGGFGNLKDWIVKRRPAFSDAARKYGLPYPKGILLVGHGGTGKSLSAKAVASYLKLPLLRLDMGRVFRSLVGESEQAMRQALQVAEAVSPVVMWLDEIEKALAGAQSSGQTDSGVTSRVISTILTWRAETQKPVMMVATANDVRSLPSMIYRRGRFDEIWYVDLPTEAERIEIFAIHIAKRGRNPEDYGLVELAAQTTDFVGAEIEAVVEDAMFSAFADEGREFTTDDLLTAVKNTIPSAARDREELSSLREWAETRARPVSKGSNGHVAKRKSGRKIKTRGVN